MLFAIFTVNLPQRWSDITLNATVVLGIVSVVHAFLIRKEYLLRLELVQRETNHVSITSMGRRWELRHSLWIAWTLSLGIFSWVAFLYIGWRVRQIRWLLWGVVYLAAFAPLPLAPTGSRIGEFAAGLVIVAGVVSVVHAFAVREDYLARLESRTQEAAEAGARARRRLEAEHKVQTVAASPDFRPKESVSSDSQSTDTVFEKPGVAREEAVPSSSETPTRDLDEVSVVSSYETSLSPELIPISDTYPLPIAYSWSLLQSLWDPRDHYREQLRHAENMLAFLGSISLAILDKRDYERAQIDLRVPWQGGISFGAWKLIVQRSAKIFRSYENHPLAKSIQRLKIGSETKGFGADIAALISARNNYHHGRGPTMEEDIINASNEAQERLERCMEALSFFTQYPIRLVQDFDVDRRNDKFVLKCLRLEGDGPGFPQEKVDFPNALPRGDLVLDLGGQNWVQLHPFIVAANCPHCRYRETYFIDRWNDRKGTTLIKSFERGHTEERKDISEFLARLAAE